MNQSNDEIEQVFKRFNSASILSAILKNKGEISIPANEIFELSKFEILNTDTEYMEYVVGEDPYSNGFNDYIRQNGDMISVKYDRDLNLFYFNMMPKEEAEKEIKDNKAIGYFCVRKTWRNG